METMNCGAVPLGTSGTGSVQQQKPNLSNFVTVCYGFIFCLL